MDKMDYSKLSDKEKYQQHVSALQTTLGSFRTIRGLCNNCHSAYIVFGHICPSCGRDYSDERYVDLESIPDFPETENKEVTPDEARLLVGTAHEFSDLLDSDNWERGILTSINDSDAPFELNGNIWYDYCRPVSQPKYMSVEDIDDLKLTTPMLMIRMVGPHGNWRFPSMITSKDLAEFPEDYEWTIMTLDGYSTEIKKFVKELNNG